MCFWCQFKLFLYVLVFIRSTTAQSEPENPIASVIRKTLIGTARSCMTQVNSTQEDLEYLRNDPPYPERSSCIVMCLLEKVGVVKNNKYSKSGFMVAVSPLILTKKKKLEHMKTVSENCDKEATTTFSSRQSNLYRKTAMDTLWKESKRLTGEQYFKRYHTPMPRVMLAA